MRTISGVLLLCLLSLQPAVAQVDYYPPNNPVSHTWKGRLTTAVNVCGGVDCLVKSIVAAVKTAGGGTVTLRDNGTGCSSGNCYIADAVALNANTTNSFVGNTEIFCPGGLSVSGTGAIDLTVTWNSVGPSK